MSPEQIPGVQIGWSASAAGADPTALPDFALEALPRAAVPKASGNADLRRVEFRAMASTVHLSVHHAGAQADEAIAAAKQVFADVEAACTRFRDDSPLMLANAAGEQWCQVPQECFDAIYAAHQAHLRTQGLFDPRVLKKLVGMGYDKTLPFRKEKVKTQADEQVAPAGDPGPWEPEFDPEGLRVRIGPEPIDLGGIGKGLAVRWAAQALLEAGQGFLLEAGGDCYLHGGGPYVDGWRISVEDPLGGSDPIATLRLKDVAVATSSTRYRKWKASGRKVHHLIDPRTGESAQGGLVAVTVVAAHTDEAEVWSKVLFVQGEEEIHEVTERENIAALWVNSEGEIYISDALKPYLMWVVDEDDDAEDDEDDDEDDVWDGEAMAPITVRKPG